MGRPLVLIDCDGVLADIVRAFLDQTYTVTGRRHHREQVTDFCFRKSGVVSEYEEPTVWAGLDPYYFPAMPGAREALQVLRSFADVVCVTTPTNRTAYWRERRQRWLEEKMGFAEGDVVFAKRKELIDGDYLLDDHHENLIKWCSGPRGTGLAVLIESPYAPPKTHGLCRHTVLGAAHMIQSMENR